MADAQFYIQIGTLIGGVGSLLVTVRMLWVKIERLGTMFDAKLNNGIRHEMTEMKLDIQEIKTTLKIST